MERSNSVNSNASSKSNSSKLFAYQANLLDSTSRGTGARLSRTSSLARSNSISDNAALSPTSSPAPLATRRWTPSHRVGASLDAVRGKWEERVRAEAALDSASSVSPRVDSVTPSQLKTSELNFRPHSPSSPTKTKELAQIFENQRTPSYLKRRTLPEPIIASPLSPNTTGLTIESSDVIAGPSLHHETSRIHLPHPVGTQTALISGSPEVEEFSVHSSPSPQTRMHRSHTVDAVSFKGGNVYDTKDTNASAGPSSRAPYIPIGSSGSIRRRPTSLYGIRPARPSLRESSDNSPSTPLPSSPRFSPRGVDKDANMLSPSAMFPVPYRSSYMSKKKSGEYGGDLSVGQRPGRSLPRIASGDVEEEITRRQRAELEPEVKVDSRLDVLTVRTDARPTRGAASTSQQTPISASEAVGVAGIPGRRRLTRAGGPSTPVPLPSARLSRGLWADTQRHLLQAYEYLCHVGEAQQWIEGCLGEELTFGVVEMEDELRNGVVLAKLVRVFQGEGAIRRIYEAPKLDFRHSDNINHFFIFVRGVGLPECFIFELTDLYEKKNLPKVIYCIHALSHLLARRGLAERIANLLGQLKFSDDQLQKTQKGLKDAGVAMPNFSNVGKELAKEIHEDPEIEIETEDERRDRFLLENEDSIIALQSLARGFLIRGAQAIGRSQLSLANRQIVNVQARCRGVLARMRLEADRFGRRKLLPWVITLQAEGRGIMLRRQWTMQKRRILASTPVYVKLQAQLRGLLARRRVWALKTALKHSAKAILKFQSRSRSYIVGQRYNSFLSLLSSGAVQFSVLQLQARLRGVLVRNEEAQRSRLFSMTEASVIALQARCKAVLIRRQMKTQMASLEDITDVVINIQAAVRTYIARKRLLSLIRALRKATPMLVTFQAHARAKLVSRQHQDLNKALSEVSVASSIGGFQTLARAVLCRNRVREQQKKLLFREPDVVGVQAVARMVLVRRDYLSWRNYLRRNEPLATVLQAMLRGLLQRRQFRQKMQYYRANLDKVVKIQSLFRAKETREQYRQLTLGKNVTVGTIKNFVHLLDDSEADFQEELKVERLRKRVVENIRENQALEHDVSELDVKIALVVQNVKSFEDLMKVKRRHGTDSAAAHAARVSILAAHGDPFARANTLDRSAKRKLELYQQLFYLLQTRGEYLSRLLSLISSDNIPEKNRRLLESVVLTLFGYGQDRREDYLLLRLFQLAIREEFSVAPSFMDIRQRHPLYLDIAVHYVRPKQRTYVRDSLQAVIQEVINSDDLDLEVNPSVIHRARVELEEMRSGVPRETAKDLPFYQALNEPDTRAEYIRHLQVLQWWTQTFMDSIIQSTKKMPYNIRHLARETLQSLREIFPDEQPDAYIPYLGRLIYYRYINPALIAPETFDIVPNTINIATRKNLAQISRVLTQIASGREFDDDDPSYVPINDYVREAIGKMSAWLLEVTDVPDAETYYHAHEFLDVTVQPKPIYISPNEVYAMHSLLSEFQDKLADDRNDTLRIILHELDGVPQFATDELSDARDKAITLVLTNRFAHVKDPHADEKALWVQAKRGVLAILRVQPAEDLVEALMRPVTEDDEVMWEQIVDLELENEQIRQHPGRMPSAPGNDSTYRLEDIRSLNFKKVKAHAIFYLLELEKQGKITRADGFQGILNAIASDVRSKHRKRLQRQQEMENMDEALRHLAERKKYFEDQINSYHDYVEAAMATMQKGKGKKRFVMPFTKQFFHLREIQRSGAAPQFGSFKYSAKDLYEKGILLSINQFSPRQFDKLDVIISSSRAGVFSIEMYNNTLGITNRMGTQDVRMEDLLQARFENRASLTLFSGLAKVNLDLFLYQINKKFYV